LQTTPVSTQDPWPAFDPPNGPLSLVYNVRGVRDSQIIAKPLWLCSTCHSFLAASNEILSKSHLNQPITASLMYINKQAR